MVGSRISTYSLCDFTCHIYYTQCALLGFWLVAKEYLVSIIKYLICTLDFLPCHGIYDVTQYYRLNSSYCSKEVFRLIIEWPNS